MKRLALLLLLLIPAYFPSVVISPQAQDKKPVVVDAGIKFPTPNTKTIEVNPGKLTNDLVYVVEGKVPFVLLASPANLVKITSDQGPIKIRARFFDGYGVETRTFQGPQLYMIEAAGAGSVELFAIPNTFKSEAEIIRRTIDVDNGQAPQPPPPTPDPTPNPNPNPTATKIQIVTFDDYQKRPANPDMSLLLGDVGYWQSIRDMGHKFRSYDVSNPASVAWKQWWKDSGGAGIPPPVVVFTDAMAPFRFLGAEKMPTSKDGMNTLIKKYSGVK